MRVQLDSQPEEIDNLERRKVQLEVELHALEKEKDKSSKARLVEVGLPQIYISNFFCRICAEAECKFGKSEC